MTRHDSEAGILRCRCLTPPGLAGLSVFRVEGREALAFLSARVDRPLPQTGQLRLMRLIHEGEWVDEVLVSQPTALTYEISTHGGLAVREAVCRLLRAGEPHQPEFDGGWGAQGKIAGEAMAALSAAWSLRGAEFFLALGSGTLDAWLLRLASDLNLQGRPSEVHRGLHDLLARANYGRAMAHGISVLLLGAPNAGKSTLANRLLRRERSIVADEAGTTRDLVEEATSFLGYPFRLVDAAGLREASDSVEQEGVRRATAAAKDAGIRLFVVDGSQPEWKASIFESDRRDSGALAVLTKRDLPHRLSVDEVEMALGVPVVEISDGDEGGLARLRAQILYRSPFAQPQAPPILTPFLDSHVRQLEESLKHLERGNFSEARDSLLSLVASGNQNRGENEPHEKGLHQHR